LPQGRALVWVTHDEQQLVSLSNREINIAGGCIK
jgi:ABC-type iron transport system FetAB ATPase subunit